VQSFVCERKSTNTKPFTNNFCTLRNPS
jgi:hypothetical protein